MLSTAIETLKKDVFDAIKSDKVAKSFETALLSTFPPESEQDADCKKMAKTFGELAAGYLAGALATPLSKAIDKFVKDAGIQITIPPSVVSPHGPCSGSIPPSNVKIL